MTETPERHASGDGPPGGRRAVVILAAGETARLADRLRKRHDPEWFERVPPHVSLLGPCEMGRPEEEVAERLEEALSDASPFLLRLGAPGAFVTPSLVLYVRIEDEAPVCEIASRVRRALPSCGTGLPFRAHLTVGRFASQGALSAALGELEAELARTGGAEPPGFRVEEVHLFREDTDTGVYSSAACVRLAGGA